VLMGQLPELRKDIPNALVKRFENGPSDAEVAFYYYRYHLACTRHSSGTRTLHSPRTRRRRIYPFVLEEYPKDPTNKLLTLTLDHPNIKLPENQQCGTPNVTLMFELISALAAWAFQTDHALAPNQSVLKILLQTQGTESEFDYVRSRLAEENMRIYAPEDIMDKARGWIAGDLKFEAVDDLEFCEGEEKCEFSVASSLQMSPRQDHSLAVLAPGWPSNSRRDASFRSTAEPLGSPSGKSLQSPSIAGSVSHSRNRSKRLSKRSLDHRLPYLEQDITSSCRKGSEIRGRPSSTRIVNSPAQAGGSTNYPVKMDREFDQFWPDLGRTMNVNEVDVGYLTTPDGRRANLRRESQEEFVQDKPVQISFEPKDSREANKDRKAVKSCCKIS